MENVLFEIQQPFNWEIAEKIMKKEIDGDIYWKNELNDMLVISIDKTNIPVMPMIRCYNGSIVLVNIQDLYCKIRIKKGYYIILEYNNGNCYIGRVKELKHDSFGLVIIKCDVAINRDNMLLFESTLPINSDCKNIAIATKKVVERLSAVLSKIHTAAIGEYDIINSELLYSKIATPEDKLLELDKKYLRIAYIWAENSYCTRRKVGAIIVKDKMIISDGYNGTPAGFENVCELDDGTTKPYVLHAEANAITKLAKSHNSSEGATLYVTTSPCMECSKLIIQAGIRRVVYCEEYSHKEGLEILQKAGVELVQIKELN